MALQSPGVQVTVIDESFYTPAEPGTTPLIVVATAQDKTNGAGTGTAAATTKANAGKAFKLTSQKDLVDLFGVPFFEKTASSTPIHGSERNEYGLLAAYSLLGVSNAAFIVRADVDLAQLEGQTSAPGAEPDDGDWWVDSQSSAWGIQEWNGALASTTGGQKFTTKTPLVLTDDDSSKVDAGVPKASVGSIGDYAIVWQDSVDELAKLYYKSAGNTVAGIAAGQWVHVGGPEWKASHATVSGLTFIGGTAGTLTVNGLTPISVGSGDTVDDVVADINSLTGTSITARNVNDKIYIYQDGTNEEDFITLDGTNALLKSLGFLPNVAGATATSITLGAPSLQQTPHTQVPAWKRTSDYHNDGKATGSVWVKTTEPGQGARLRVKRYSAATASWVAVEAPMYASNAAANYYLDRSGGGLNLSANVLYTETNANEYSGVGNDVPTATFKIWKRKVKGVTSITSTALTGTTFAISSTYSFTLAESKLNSATLTAISVSFTTDGSVSAAENANSLAGAINAAGFTNIEASASEDNKVTITHKLGGEFRFSSGTGGVIGGLFASADNVYAVPLGDSTYDYLASNWEPFIDPTNTGTVNVNVTPDAPLNEPADGQLWFNTNYSEVDIMVHNGETWVGYRNEVDNDGAKLATMNGWAPSVAASNPYVAGETMHGDLWISTADLENFPTVYRYNENLSGPEFNRWEQVDKTDQVTEEGILFADARWRDESANSSSPTGTGAADSIEDLLESNFLDTDAPDPALYPKGMLLWNLRRSGGNVKQYKNSYVSTAEDNARYDSTNSPLGQTFEAGQSMINYATDRWVTASGNNEDGSGSFGRKAQRKVVTQALKSVVDTSQEIRDEERRNFNLIAAPGYPELLSNLVNLNIDRGLTAFVVGDTPFRLPSDATSLTNWGTNAELVTDNGEDGITTYDEYMAVFYPSGFTTDLGGSNAVVPSSHMMLKTIALSDNVSYPWFAPAGTRRGGITNATAVGYIDAASGEFQTVALNEGQRDTLYDLKVNPITFFNGVGLVNYGQKTRARNASALDRINVARLVVYLRSQLNKLARPYIFEPNDKITRDEIKQAVESLLLELVGLRALYDFAVVCDESNNTPARIDRNELYVDIAIEPVKAVEFIYIPLRVKNTGEI